MPELPEVETMRIQLEKFLVGSVIQDIKILSPKIISGNIKEIIGGKVTGVRRFAKVTSIDLDNGYSILTHVKLTGQLLYKGKRNKERVMSPKVIGGLGGKHTHVIFHLNDGDLFYNDIRRFGWIRVVRSAEIEKEKFISKLGPEPFKGLTLEVFKNILSKSARPIKVVLMDQVKIGGIGNIYANDALWLAQIDPRKPSKQLDNKTTRQLYDAILKVLKNGLKYGGASELAFVTPDGQEGEYQNHTLVFNHTGELCSRPACRQAGVKIEKYFLAGRGTYWCKMCQK